MARSEQQRVGMFGSRIFCAALSAFRPRRVRAYMLRQRLNAFAALPIFRILALVSYALLFSAIASPQTPPTPDQPYVPPELQVADPKVKASLDSAEKSAKLGNYGECLTFLQKALELATKQRSPSD